MINLNGANYLGLEILTLDRIYYVRTDGSDNNTGLTNTSGGAFLTIQKAVNTIRKLFLDGYGVTIQVGDGTHTGSVALKMPLGSGSCTIQGNNSSPSNVVISVTGADCFKLEEAGTWLIKDLKVQTTTSGNGLVAAIGGAKINFSNINFGQVATIHLIALNGGSLEATGNYTVSGSSLVGAHLYAISHGSIITTGRTVNITNTPSFSAGWAWSDRGLGYFEAYGMTFSGSATGKRYSINSNSVCFVSGGGANYFPGNAAGTTDGFGVYS